MFNYNTTTIINSGFNTFFSIATNIIEQFNINRKIQLNLDIHNTLWNFYHIKLDTDCSLYQIFNNQLYMFLLNYVDNPQLAIKHLFLSKLCLGLYLAQMYEHKLTPTKFNWETINKTLRVCDPKTQTVIRANIKCWFIGV